MSLGGAEPARIPVVGIGVDGLAGLAPRSLDVLRAATAIHGSPRQLALLDVGDGGIAEIPRVDLPRPLLPGLVAAVRTAAARGEVFLASGDPMFHGLGATIARIVANAGDIPARVESHPAPSSASLATARLGWPLADTPTLSLLTRPAGILYPYLFPGSRFLVLCADASGPTAVARFLVDAGRPGARVHVLSDLTPDAGVHIEATAAALAGRGNGESVGVGEGAAESEAEGNGPAGTPAGTPWSDLVVLAVDIPAGSGSGPGPAHGLDSRVPGLEDAAFDSDGQLTKRIPRSVFMSLLRPYPGALLWDVGGGSGSISVEWARAAPGARAVCHEASAERRARIERNVAALGLEAGRRGVVVRGAAPPTAFRTAREVGVGGEGADSGTATSGHADAPLVDAPDAVFVGGGLTTEGMVEWAWGALRPGGRFVATAVTVEGERLLHELRAVRGGEILRLGVEHLRPLGGYSGWEPARHLVIYVGEKADGDRLDESQGESRRESHGESHGELLEKREGGTA